MTYAKSAAKWFVEQLRKELTIQKPSPKQASATRIEYRQESSQDRILKRGLGGFAMIGLITVVMAILVL